MRRKSLLLFSLIMLCLSTPAHAQLWSGIVDPSRAIDWSKAGVVGGIPARTTICSTLSAGATAAQITSAIASCPSGQVVKLNAGTYNLSTGIDFAGHSNVTLRGAGPDQTFLKFTNSVNCRGFGAAICLASPNNPQMPTPSNTTTWTAGYAVGATQLTFGSTAGMSVGTLLILDQLDDSSDPGTIFACAGGGTAVCSGEGGNAYGRTGRSQQQLVKVTAINSNVVTVTPGLYMPNWRSGQSPGVSWASGTPTLSGIEDLSIDNTSSSGADGIVMLYAYNVWVKNVRSINSARNHVYLYQTAHSTVRDSYFYGGQGAGSQSYGIESFSTSDNLAENNIFQHTTGPITVNGSDVGSVWSYNFAIDDNYTVSLSWMIPSNILHEAGIAMVLFEGNSGLSFEGDDIHGTHHFATAFRNHFYGDIYNIPVKTSNTDVVHLWAFNRYFNIIGNVLGRTGYYITYETNLNSLPTNIFTLGDAPAPNPYNPGTDANVKTTLMRWGNYDTVNAANRFLCSEVPAGLAQYANPCPGSQVLPASFYLSAKPSWWGTMPWPATGPDVTSGDISGIGGHAYRNPARVCYDNSPKAGGTLTFNANNCYGNTAPAPPSPPTNLKVQ